MDSYKGGVRMGTVFLVMGLVLLALLVGSLIVEAFIGICRLDNTTFSGLSFLSVLLIALGSLLQEVGL